MVRKQQPENAFETALHEQHEMAAAGTVDNGVFFDTVNALELTGLELTGSGDVKTERFAAAMHEVYSRIADLEIVPPLNESQTKLVAGKVAVYAAMREVAQPKTRRRSKPTDVSDSPTDKPKP